MCDMGWNNQKKNSFVLNVAEMLSLDLQIPSDLKAAGKMCEMCL